MTDPASGVKGTSATLNGAAGAGVPGGDPTQWFFKYGTTMGYGKQTPTQTLGACPSGINPPSPYCTTPASQGVAAKVSGLTPCTTYHFQLFATNPDTPSPIGGHDKTFKTKFASPISRVNSPNRVRRGRVFKVKITLRFRAAVAIAITRHRHVVTTIRLGSHRAGTFTVRIRAPFRTGKYTLNVIARLSCGTQVNSSTLRVH